MTLNTGASRSGLSEVGEIDSNKTSRVYRLFPNKAKVVLDLCWAPSASCIHSVVGRVFLTGRFFLQCGEVGLKVRFLELSMRKTG